MSAIQALSYLDGRVIMGSIESVSGVDADGIGADPSYDVALYPEGHPTIRIEGTRPTFFRHWQQESTPADGVFTKAAPEGTSVMATVRGGKLYLWIPEGPAIFMQDCEEQSGP